MSTLLFDLHVHFSFKPANSSNYKSGQEPDPDHWRERMKKKDEYSDFLNLVEKVVIKSSQCHGDACSEGRHRILVNGLYPLERGFVRGAPTEIAATLSGFSVPTIRLIQNAKLAYYDQLVNEYENLLANENGNGPIERDHKYHVCGNFKEVMSKLKNSAQDICVVNSIEGAHAFYDLVLAEDGFPVGTDDERKHIKSLHTGHGGNQHFMELIESCKSNIEKTKSTWKKHPFFVGVSHHYANHLAGHCESIGAMVDLLANQDEYSLELDNPNLPLRYYSLGLYPWGKEVVELLLSRRTRTGKAVPRYLVDVKHFSAAARVDYYNWLDQYHQANPNDHIPIVKSHSAVASLEELESGIEQPVDRKAKNKLFNPLVINLFDDEIDRIIKSDGLIGLMIDERRIVGKKIAPESGYTKPENNDDFKNKGPFNKDSKKSKKALNQIGRRRHKITWCLDELAGTNDPDEIAEIQRKIIGHQRVIKERQDVLDDILPKIKDTYLSMIFRQLFFIVNIGGEKAWNHVCLGSDYDGVINPLDIYPTCAEMNSLKDDLVQFWEANLTHNNSKVRTLYNQFLFGKTPAHWVDKFMVLNGMNFLKKYFTKEYMIEGKVPRKGWRLTNNEMMLLTRTMV